MKLPDPPSVKRPRFHIIWLLVGASLCLIPIVLISLRQVPYRSPTSLFSNPTFSTPLELPFESVTVAQVAQRHPENPHYEGQLQSLVHILVTNYIAWHTEQQKRLAQDPAYARSLPVLVFRGDYNYGIGDRIRGLLHAYLGAVATNRFFLIDLPKPFPFPTVLDNPEAHNFTYDQAAFLEAGCNETRLLKMTLYNNLTAYLSDDQLLVDETTPVLDWVKFLRTPERYPLLPMSRDFVTANLTGFAPTREEIVPFFMQALFRVSPLLRQQFAARAVSHRYISIHGRYGYGLGEKTARFNFTDYSLSMRATAKCLAILADAQFSVAKSQSSERKNQRGMTFPAEGAFFIAADTTEGKQMLEEELQMLRPGAIVQSGNWTAVHAKGLGGAETDRKFEQFVETWLDIALLAGGEDIVFIWSGFSHVALWMGAMRDPLGVQLRHCQQLLVQNDTVANVSKTARDEQAAYYLERMGDNAYKL